MPVIFNLLAKPSAVKALKEARALLEAATPLKADCGKYCGCACCQADESGENGMLLFPFEDSFYREEAAEFDYHLSDDDTLFKGGKRFVCEGSCKRENRPLACRLFPLRIRVVTDDQTGEAHAEAEIDPRAWAVCPLLERGGLNGLSREFVQAVENAGDVLIGNTCHLEALLNEQKMLDETRHL